MTPMRKAASVPQDVYDGEAWLGSVQRHGIGWGTRTRLGFSLGVFETRDEAVEVMQRHHRARTAAGPIPPRPQASP